MTDCITRMLWPVIAGVVIGLGATAQAGVLLVTGSPEYDSDTGTGRKGMGVTNTSGLRINNGGTGVGLLGKKVCWRRLTGRRTSHC